MASDDDTSDSFFLNGVKLNFSFGTQEPEDPLQRPCGCPVCRDAPSAAPGDASPVTEQGGGGDALEPGGGVGPAFAGVYPRGLEALAAAELSRVGATVVAHLEAYGVLVFRLPPPQGAAARPVELSTFEVLFELLTGAEPSLPPAPTVADVAAAAHAQVRPRAASWRRSLRCFSRWKITVHRDHQVDRYKMPEVVPAVGSAIAAAGAVSLAGGCTAGPVVDLDHAEVEVIAYLSDGVDKLRAAIDSKNRFSLGGSRELLLLGVRSSRTLCRPPALDVQKARPTVSRADDTVSLCVAQKAADLLGKLAGTAQAASSARVLDPMCGVGTYLSALQWVLEQRGSCGFNGVELFGVDIDAESLGYARANSASSSAPITAINASSAALPFRDGSMDLLVVDPPWGQRHSKPTYVTRFFPAWAREWARVLKPGGAAVVVTIVKKCVFRCTEELGLLELEEKIQFDNKGWRLCFMFVLRKPLTIPAATASHSNSG